MRPKILASAATLLLLAACAGAPPDSSSTTGNGTGTGLGSNALGSNALGGAAKGGPGSQQDLEQTAGDRVFFDSDQSTVKPEGRQTLERQAAWLKRYPNVTVTIEGHCDERGTREYNLALGERRAVAAKQVLVSLGVDQSRLKTASYGKERPAVVGSNDAAWAQNRRAVTTVD